MNNSWRSTHIRFEFNPLAYKLLLSICTLLTVLVKGTWSIKPIKYFDFPGIGKYHSIHRVGEFFLIGTENTLFYANVGDQFNMKKFPVPPEL
jgi:hypothetical protein